MEIDPARRRLLELADERRVSLTRLSQMLGKNPSYLQQFVRKGSPRRLEEQDRGMLARFFGVGEDELGRMRDNSYAIADTSRKSDWIDVPRLAIGASAGPGSLAEGEAAFDTIRFSSRWLRTMGLQPGHLSTIVVSGDSMEPTLRDGDEILVDRALRPRRDGIHVVRLGESLLVKRLDTARSGVIVLISDNAAYPPVECAPQDVEVIGRVVWKGGRI
ncbi:transcriptional regulator [Novosphingobium barchaimii LL02]|uniref:Transcriptional regulator n=1 Tax=Novosphingobium barchaimii LL02 TaxID=1114963 RepID=A0A0J8AYE7_9SPHN|nr:S24 family peptidase [Novosphingobium barchaimii]KMS59225.1 transcriptional regulator [Novosphingobium barchaimii LL02]